MSYMKTPIYLMSLAIFASSAAAADSPGPASRTMPSEMICTDCDFSFMRPAVPLPKHGVVLAYGGFMSPGGSWMIIDWDASSYSVVQTTVDQLAGEKRVLKRDSESTMTLTTRDQAKLRAMVDGIWSSNSRIAGQEATDVVWDLYLIDDKVVRHEGGMVGLPGGAAAQLAKALNKFQPKVTK